MTELTVLRKRGSMRKKMLVLGLVSRCLNEVVLARRKNTLVIVNVGSLRRILRTKGLQRRRMTERSLGERGEHCVERTVSGDRLTARAGNQSHKSTPATQLGGKDGAVRQRNAPR